MKQLQDHDPMPYGKRFKGVPMEDVPAWHLRWWWNEGKKNEVKTDPLAEYINRNMMGLMKEDPGGIWEK